MNTNVEEINKKSNQNNIFLLCCPCLNRKKDVSLTSVYSGDIEDGPYEYVVEKLAIKKVPLHTFATDEDLQDLHETISKRSSESSIVSARSFKSEKENKDETASMQDKKSVVTFSSYYAVAPKSDIETASRTSAPQREESAISVHSNDEVEVKPSKWEPQLIAAPVKIQNTDKEEEVVSHILNQCASLFTLDRKEIVPKDPLPLNPPKYYKPIVIPSNIKRRLMHTQQCEVVQVHMQPEDSVKFSDIAARKEETVNRKEVPPPDIQETINALGVAQRPPRTPGFPPKNIKYLDSPIRHDHRGEEEMITCNTLVDSSRSRSLTPPLRFSDSFENLKKFSSTENIPYKTEDVSNITALSSTIHGKQNTNAFLKLVETEPKSTPYVPETSDDARSSAESQQITEISQLKGQSLKWKIIIKHHTDTDKNENSTEEEKTDQYYIKQRSRTPSLSPKR